MRHSTIRSDDIHLLASEDVSLVMNLKVERGCVLQAASFQGRPTA